MYDSPRELRQVLIDYTRIEEEIPIVDGRHTLGVIESGLFTHKLQAMLNYTAVAL